MVSDVLQDYQRAPMQDLPQLRNTDGIELPAKLGDGRLLATWSTIIGGEPAQAYAVRHGNDIIVQYRIAESVLFRNPGVRRAMAITGISRFGKPGSAFWPYP